MARIPHPPKREFPHTMLIWSNIEGQISTKPLRINNVKFETAKKYNSDQLLISSGLIFIDSKHSSGFDDINKDFSVNSRIEINNETFTIASTDYVNIASELHHLEIILK